ncbi:MAG: hypothetical protein IT320_06525 [Anaerolineae bacterium]|nr:hypothetical protein [Anaerolineae bacterium]
MAAHDNLDLPALIAQGKRYRRAARIRFYAIAAILLILLIPAVVLTYRITLPSLQLYRLDASGEWARFDLPSGDVMADTINLVMDDAGALWAVDGDGGLLSRYRNGLWVSYPSFSTGVELHDNTRITTDGEQLWGATGSDIFHFDGAHWEVFRDTLLTDVPLAIAAGEYGVFVIDADNNLSRFWQGAWKHTPVIKALPGVSIEEDFYDEIYPPVFIRMADGSLWLSYRGLWRFDGDGWQPAGSESAQYYGYLSLVGATGEAIWYLDGYGVQRLDTRDGKTEEFWPDSIGMKDYIWAGAVLGERVWVGSGDAVYVYEDDTWHWRANLPDVGDGVPVQLAPGPDDSLLLTVFNRGTTASVDDPDGIIAGSMLSLLTPLLLIAADFFLRYIPNFRQSRRRWAETRAILASLPEFDAQDAVPNPLNARHFILSYFVQVAFMLIAMTGMLFVLTELIDSARIAVEFALSAGLGYVLARSLVSGYLLSLGDTNTRTNVRLLMHGDYDHLLERNGYPPDETDAQAAKHGNPIWQIYGLLLAGRHEEALPLLREIVRRPGVMAQQNVAMLVANIGYCLINMERHDEALPYLEAATRLAPELAIGYEGLAHYYLNTESDPARALDMIDVASQFDSRPLIGNALADYGRLGRQMSHALALAFNARCDEALALATQTANDRAMKLLVIAASMHVEYAQILQQCGQPDAARAHFEQALALDPNGSRGQQARKQLHKSEGTSAQDEDGFAGNPVSPT